MEFWPIRGDKSSKNPISICDTLISFQVSTFCNERIYDQVIRCLNPQCYKRREERHNRADCEDRRREPLAKEGRQPLEARKCKEVDPPGRKVALPTSGR